MKKKEVRGTHWKGNKVKENRVESGVVLFLLVL